MEVSSTVTVALPAVTSVSCPSVFQYAPGADVTRVGPLPVVPPQSPLSDATQAPLHSVPETHWQAPPWQT